MRSIITVAAVAFSPVLIAVGITASTASATTTYRCTTHTGSGSCYKPGQFCPKADANSTTAGLVKNGFNVMTCELTKGRWRWVQRAMWATTYEIPCIEAKHTVYPAAGAGGAAGQVTVCTATVRPRNPASLGDQMVLTTPDRTTRAFNLS